MAQQPRRENRGGRGGDRGGGRGGRPGERRGGGGRGGGGAPGPPPQPRARQGARQRDDFMDMDDADNDEMDIGEPKHRIPRIGYNRLRELANLPAEELLNTISTERSGFPHALEDQPLMKKPDCMGAILAVIKTALKSTNNPQAKIVLLNKIRASSFLKHGLPDYHNAMQLETSAPKLRGFRQPIKDTLFLFKELMTSFPGNIQVFLGTLIVFEFLIRGLRQSTAVIDDEIETSLDEMCAQREELIAKEKSRKTAEAAAKEGGSENNDVQQVHDIRQPPDNFRDMTIFPDVQQDIMTRRKPFIRPNVIKGGYEDVGHYLDIQFRLLREDFVQPLRQGIKEYLDLQKETGRRVRLADIRVYHDVSVLMPICTHSGIQYKIRFDVTRMRQINWRYSKRLIYGSLLCLSKDEFNTIYIATVADRKPEMLQEGYLQVKFEVDPDAVRRIQPDERFLMVETSAYFEAYRHVLTALQTMEEVDIPFRENIIKCGATVNPPRYLLTAAEPTYNIQPLIDGHRPPAFRQHDSDDDSDEDYGISPFSALPILQIRRWPTAETLHLDDSQLRAIQAALTRELTIIQGPPGTGKTHIGLKIVEALYLNRRVWNPRGADNSPVLVVCYTNHALDQFLEGISRFLKSGIVRVGGRSKNEKMKGFLLSELRRKVREMRSVPRAIFHARMDIRQEMEKWQVEIEKTAALIDGTERGLIHEKILEDLMSDDHYMALTERVHLEEGEQGGVFSNKSSGLGPSYLPGWLGLGEMLYMEEDPALEADPNVEGGEDAPADAPVEALGEAPAERIEIEDDVAAIEAERLLELEDEELALRRHQEEARRRRNLEQANQRLAVDFDNLPEVEGEWQVQRGNKKKRRERMQRGLRSTDIMPEEETRRVRNLWGLNLAERWRMYRYWVSLYKKDLKENVLECETQFQIAADRLREILEDEDRAIMQTMNVIGMTTTGAARYKNTLRQISPKIVIVEEAAEVLEAHVITTLSSGCEHLVLIGDHKQLRPSANVYKLAEEYNLKYSLFERLVLNELPFETLENQHRMRPEIANLVRLIYPELKDHDAVKLYDDIKGVETNLFLINHDEEELKDEELKSVSNYHEATFVVALCRYLLLQGYHPSQVTILTPYTGQMFLFKRLMPKEQFEGVRVCPVDNYQGEENDIVLLSLVRSNSVGKIGFVKDDNRACVAMSRAKRGLFVIGNFDHIAKHSDLWSKITQEARKMGNFGEELTLCCQNHPQEARIVVRCAKDFDQVPEGGCLRPCGFRLDCGHACERVCHSYDRDHTNYRCKKPCRKVMCANNHVCKKRCHDPCGECKQTVQKVMPNCGHLQQVPCGVFPYDFKCQGECNHRLRCGHLCNMKCGEEHTKRCVVKVEKTLSCGHSVRVKCHQQNEAIHCVQPCGSLLDCHHPCPGQCGDCMQGRLHVPCKFDCGRNLVCGHQCSEPCTKNCPPCSKRCENRCQHSRCPRECGRACEPCREQCHWRCQHYQCTMLCHQPCDRPRCDASCKKRLGCGHQCIGVCGEPCPKKCRICHRDEVIDIFFGNEEDDDARFVQLEDCGHIFEVDGLDHWMDMATETNPANDIQMKRCPRCNTTIRRNLRYGTIINSLLCDIERVKALILGDRRRNVAKQKELARRLDGIRLMEFAEDQTKFYRNRLNGPDLATDEVSCIENVINFFVHITDWYKKVDALIRETTDGQVRVKLYALKSEMDPLQLWLLKQRVRFSDQELREAVFELTRFDLLVKYIQLEGKLNTCRNPGVTEDLRRRFLQSLARLRSGEPLTNAHEAEAKQAANDIQPLLGGLAISDEERVQIIEAMGMGQGHWFKCPNGHVYAITECGGAMEESKCPECGAGIGGQNHALRGDNRLASEMDGATAPAFDPRMLMNAAQLRQFQF